MEIIATIDGIGTLTMPVALRRTSHPKAPVRGYRRSAVQAALDPLASSAAG